MCVSPQNGFLVALTARGFPKAGVTVGRVFITKARPEIDLLALQEISRHEGWHGQQWAAASLVAGPAALPVAYGAAEAVFPGAQNPFERAAGLSDGGYTVPDGICPAPFGIVMWVFAAAGALVVRRRMTRPSAHAPGCRHVRRDTARRPVILRHIAGLTARCRTTLSAACRWPGPAVITHRSPAAPLRTGPPTWYGGRPAARESRPSGGRRASTPHKPALPRAGDDGLHGWCRQDSGLHRALADPAQLVPSRPNWSSK